MNKFRLQSGFTLTELMIAMSIGLTVISGVTGVLVSVVSSSSNMLLQSKLNSQLTGALEVMSNDIRRAGYWAMINPDDYAAPTGNPFSQMDSTLLEVHDNNVQVAGNDAGGGDCIVYAYDADNDGALGNQDIVGFRLQNNAIQMRRNGDVNANARHDACNNGNDNWQNMTDPNVVSITALNFSLANSACINNREPDNVDNDGANGVDDADEADCFLQPPAVGSLQNTVETRAVTITVSGLLVGDPLTSMTVRQDIRVRNDFVRVW